MLVRQKGDQKVPAAWNTDVLYMAGQGKHFAGPG